MGLGVLGAVATAATVTVAVGSLELTPPSITALASACQDFLLPDLSFAALLTLSLTVLGVAVLMLAGRSLARQIRGHRRFLAGLSPVATADVGEVPVTVVDDPRPQALCAGYLRPRIYLSRGAMHSLTFAEVGAVVAHERHHLRRRDPLRILLARIIGDSLFFMPVLHRLAERYSDLSELAADEAAVRRAGAGSLASALLVFGERESPAAVVGIARERVDHLLGQGPRWELPMSLLAGSLVAIAVLLAVAFGTAPLMSSSSLNLPMLLAQTCMAAMTGLAILIAGSALLFSRPLFARLSR